LSAKVISGGALVYIITTSSIVGSADITVTLVCTNRISADALEFLITSEGVIGVSAFVDIFAHFIIVFFVTIIAVARMRTVQIITRRVWCSGANFRVVTLVHIGACVVCGIREITRIAFAES
jgi:hypothetical protein